MAERKRESRERKFEYSVIGKAGGSGGKSLRLKSGFAEYLELTLGDYVVVFKDIDPKTKEKVLVVKKAKP